MVYIETDNNLIKLTHYSPLHVKYGLGKTKEELIKTGYLIEKLPPVLEIEGSYHTMHWDDVKKEVYYKYHAIEGYEYKSNATK